MDISPCEGTLDARITGVDLGLELDDAAFRAIEAALPPVEHPLARRHPKTGREILYLGRHASHILGENVEESRALLQKLCDDACQPPAHHHPLLGPRRHRHLGQPLRTAPGANLAGRSGPRHGPHHHRRRGVWQ